MQAWKTAHDHQVVMLDRRLANVEAAAGRAEEETRLVSIQISGLSKDLDRQPEQRSKP